MSTYRCWRDFAAIALCAVLIPLNLVGLSASELLPASHEDRCSYRDSRSNTFYVDASSGVDSGDGSALAPWLSITKAISKVPDDSLILVRAGVYKEKIKFRRAFTKGITVRSEFPYEARLEENQRVVAFIKNARNIHLEGFEITHTGDGASPLIVHIDSGARKSVSDIVIRNNVIHDSYNNDLLKINNGATSVAVICNLFYNQGNSDEHIDINSASKVTVKGNVFFNDFSASGREKTARSSSFIAIKDSNGDEDQFVGASNIYVGGNIFFNWEGSVGAGFVLAGEDGKPYYEASNIHIFNNLFLGNSGDSMRSPIGVKGARDVYFYNNTVSGDLPSNAYSIRVNKEGENLTPRNIVLYNNIWSDPTGTMGSGSEQLMNDFSDTTPFQVADFTLAGNVYWNGGARIPASLLDTINYYDDDKALFVDPALPAPIDLVSPLWDRKTKRFDGGYLTIEQIFRSLVLDHGIPLRRIEAVAELPAPEVDIRNKPRAGRADIGAFQH